MSYSVFHYRKITTSNVKLPSPFNSNSIVCLYMHGQMCSSVVLLPLCACFCFIRLKSKLKFLLNGYLKNYSPNYLIYHLDSSLNAEQLQKRE